MSSEKKIKANRLNSKKSTGAYHIFIIDNNFVTNGALYPNRIVKGAFDREWDNCANKNWSLADWRKALFEAFELGEHWECCDWALL